MKIKKVIFFTFLLSVTLYHYSFSNQITFHMENAIGNINENTKIISILNLPNSKIVVSGIFNDSIYINDKKIRTNGLKDIFVYIQDSLGKILSGFTIGGNKNDILRKAVIKDNFIYLLIQGSQFISYNEQTKINYTHNNPVIILKYNLSGELIWQREMVQIQKNLNYDFAVSEYGDVIIVSEFENYGKFGQYIFNSKGGIDWMVLKLNQENKLLGISQIGGKSNDSLINVKTDEKGQIYISGISANSINMNGEIITIENDKPNLYLLKMNNKVSIWDEYFINEVKGKENMEFKSFTILNDGRFYVYGNFKNRISIKNTELVATNLIDKDIFLLSGKFNKSAIELKKMGGKYDDKILDIQVINNDKYLIGKYQTKLMLSEGKSEETLSKYGSTFVLKADSLNAEKWVKNIAEERNNLPQKIIMDYAGFVYIVGNFDNQIKLNNNSSINYEAKILNNKNNGSGYMTKIWDCDNSDPKSILEDVYEGCGRGGFFLKVDLSKYKKKEINSLNAMSEDAKKKTWDNTGNILNITEILNQHNGLALKVEDIYRCVWNDTVKKFDIKEALNPSTQFFKNDDYTYVSKELEDAKGIIVISSYPNNGGIAGVFWSSYQEIKNNNRIYIETHDKFNSNNFYIKESVENRSLNIINDSLREGKHLFMLKLKNNNECETIDTAKFIKNYFCQDYNFKLNKDNEPHNNDGNVLNLSIYSLPLNDNSSKYKIYIKNTLNSEIDITPKIYEYKKEFQLDKSYLEDNIENKIVLVRTDVNECVNVDTLSYYNGRFTQGGQNPENQVVAQAFPNITEGKYRVYIKNHDPRSPLQLRIIDVPKGIVYYERTIPANSPQIYHYDIDITWAAYGIYKLLLINGNKQNIISLIKI